MKLTPIPNFANRGIYIDDLDFNNLSVGEWVDLKTRLYSKYLLIIFRNTNLPLTDYATRMSQWGHHSNGLKYFFKKYNLPASEFYLKFSEGNLQPLYRHLYDMANKYNISFDDLDIIENSIGKIDKLSNSDSNLIVTRLKGKGATETNKPRDTNTVFLDGELAWHSDESMDIAFCDTIGLYGNNAMTASATGFITTSGWYESQSDSFRSELDSMIAKHKYQPTKFNENQDPLEERIIACQNGSDTEIPLVINSPAGITGLHYPLNSIVGIVDMSKSESDSLFKYINKTLFVDSNIYDHWYKSDNDLVIFDNSITLHRRLGSTFNRIAYRTNFYFQDPIADRYLQPEYQEKYRSILSKYN